MLEIIEIQEKKIWLVGTAHISKESAEEVEQTISEVEPDAVCIELCPTRFKHLKEAKRWQDTDIIKVIKSGQTMLLLANLMLSSFQKKMGRQLGVKPGEEMMQAVKSAQEKHIPIELIDREMSITLKRTMGSMSAFERYKMLNELLISMFYTEKISAEDIENLKNTDTISSMIAEVGRVYPRTKETLIDERDTYMAQKILQTSGSKIVAVVGAGHMEGIKKELHKEADLTELEKIPPKGHTGQIIKFLISAAVIGFLIYSFQTQGSAVATELLGLWIVSHSILAALGAFIGGAGILSSGLAALVGPVSPFNPVIKVAIWPSLLEAYLRKPKVADFEDLSNFNVSLRNLRSNRITRLLMISVLAALGNTLATALSLVYFSSAV